MKQASLAWLLVALAVPLQAAEESVRSQVRAASSASVREWSARVDDHLASGRLIVRLTRNDTMIAGRRHERLAQVHDGVPVFGGELIRQSDASGVLTIFGTFYGDITLDTRPTLGPGDIEVRLAGRGGRPFGAWGGPQLVVLPTDAGGYRLAWRVRAFFDEPFDVRQLFFDANTGETLLDYRDIHTQAAGPGTGVLGDQKKVSVTPSSGEWQTNDRLRPPAISTYDFAFDVNRLILFWLFVKSCG